MRLRVALVLMAVAASVGGCGSGQRPGNRVRGRTLTVYFSGPTRGASGPAAMAALDGARLALADARFRVGEYRIRLRALDDSTPQSPGWDPDQTTLNARLAAQDPTTIGYLGDFNSGASAISIPLLNRVGIPQLSPGSTAVGLTTAGTGASPGEPAKYYPTGARSFARVIPTDADQAAAIVRAEQEIGCNSTFVLQDEEVDGEDAALTFLLTAQSAGLRVIAVQAFQRLAADYSALVRGVGASGADCVLISSIDESSAARLTEQIAAAVPRATIVALNGLADSAYTDPAEGGIPLSVDPRVIVISAAPSASAYPRSVRVVLAAYAREFGPPEPQSVFGYEAMKVMLAAVARATDGGHRAAERSKVLQALFATRVADSPLGSFRIDRAGDTTLRSFGAYRIVARELTPLGPSG